MKFEKRNQIFYFLLIANTIAFVIVFVFLFSLNRKLDFLLYNFNPEQTQIVKDQIKIIDSISVENDPMLGSPYAPVSFIVFSDYQCGHCRNFYDSIFPEIKKNYIDKGLIAFYVKNCPKTNTSLSYFAAIAAQLAQEKNIFWEYHKAIFAEQTYLSTDKVFFSLSKIGIDSISLINALDDDRINKYVVHNMDCAKTNEIFGFPAFVINHKLYIGNRSFEAFQKIIDEEISKSFFKNEETCE